MTDLLTWVNTTMRSPYALYTTIALLVSGLMLLVYRRVEMVRPRTGTPIDATTGLWTASHLNRALNAEIDRARPFNRPIALALVSIDGLSGITRAHGRQTAESVLRRVAEHVQGACRPYDVAGVLSSGVFYIILPEMVWSAVLSVAEGIRDKTNEITLSLSSGAQPFSPTVSIGVSFFPRDADTAIGLISAAEQVLEVARQIGPNRVESTVSNRSVESDAFARSTAQPSSLTTQRQAADVAALRTRLRTDRSPAKTPAPPRTLALVMAGVITLGVVVALVGSALSPHYDWLAVALVGILAILAQLPRVKNLYQGSSVSVSVAVNFAAALLGGIPAVVVSSAAIAFAHWLQRRPASYKTLYNWATHILAGSLVAVVFTSLGIPVRVDTLLVLAPPVILCALGYYLIDTGLIAVSLGLSSQTPVVSVWRERCQWLGVPYVVLCILGLCLCIAYNGLGVLGLLTFTVPVLMMAYAQKQYLDKAEQSMKDVERANQELAAAHRSAAAATASARQLNEEILATVAQLIDTREPNMAGHSQRVAVHAVALAEDLNLPPLRVDAIRQAAYLHDIGKIGVPDGILGKVGRLTAEEYEAIKQHVQLGVQLLESCPQLSHLAPIVRYHHERWDGHGYPDGVQGGRIPIEARILSLGDAVDAMASGRAYRAAMNRDEIIAELRRAASAQLDPHLCEVYIRILLREPTVVPAQPAAPVAETAAADQTTDTEQGRTLTPRPATAVIGAR
jgi:diguanylate cyclase (GGDEF)-like protein/putative nucleotidyltransferase with HDIG domain